MKNFKATVKGKSIHLEGTATNIMGEDYPVSLYMTLEEAQLPHAEAVKWAKERGGELPSVNLLQEIQRHRDEINKVISSHTSLSGGYWSREKVSSGRALLVDMINGGVGGSDTHFYGCVRAVSAFHFK